MIWLTQLLTAKIIRPIDLEFARFIAERYSNEDPALALLALLVSTELGKQNVCLDLTRHDLQHPLGRLPEEIVLPDLTVALKQLESYPCIVAGDPQILQPAAPLVLYANRLYLQRYWHYEASVAQYLKNAMTQDSHIDPPFIAQWMDKLFAPSNEIDWQKVACAIALTKRFSVITGGPGTGKTTTVTKLLALIVLQHLQHFPDQKPIIKLVTPTGKAAARLSESIKSARQQQGLEDEIVQLIPDTASTIHRLLGVRAHSNEFIHNTDNRLHLDVLVVDEVSMVDLPMMAKLLAALPDRCKVIMLGDKDQLASVEAGSVLADICGNAPGPDRYSSNLLMQIQTLTDITLKPTNQESATLSDSICLLQKSYRFDDKKGIGQLSQAVKRGDSLGIRHLQKSDDPALLFHDISPTELSQSKPAKQGNRGLQHLINTSAIAYQPYLQMVHDRQSAKLIIECFNRYQVLCGVKEGEFGVSGINQAIENRLKEMKLIDPKHQYYPGRPIMISQNDYGLQLYNGDVGLILPDQTSGQLKAWFVNPDGEVRSVYPNRLPHHEAVYAMTVHKSQGSEFDQVSMVLPVTNQGTVSRVITKELLYTGITRAKTKFNLYASPAVLMMAIRETTERASGLGDMLYSPIEI